MLIPTPDPDHGDLRTRRPLCLSAQRENESASWEPVRGSRGDGAVDKRLACQRPPRRLVGAIVHIEGGNFEASLIRAGAEGE